MQYQQTNHSRKIQIILSKWAVKQTVTVVGCLATLMRHIPPHDAGLTWRK